MRSVRCGVAGLVLWWLLCPFEAAAGLIDPFASLHPSELYWNRLFQSIGDVSGLMRAISALGPGSLMWGMIVALFFAGYPRLGARLVVFTLLAHWLREVLALSLQSPRPYWLDPAIQTFGDVATKRTSYGLPSGHAFVGSAFWMFVAAEVRRGWFWLAAAVLVVAICLSRIYLGVHFVSDVVTGAVLGSSFAGCFRWMERRWGGAVMGLSPRVGALTAVGVGLGMVVLGWGLRTAVASDPVPDAIARYATEARRLGTFALLGGSLAGLAAGLYLAGPGLWERLQRHASWNERCVRIGIAGVIGYGVSKLVQAPLVRGSGLGEDGPLRWMALFLMVLGLTALVWWGLPRFLDAVAGRSHRRTPESSR